MKLTINGDEVEIRVKARYSDKANKQDAMDLLNLISIYAQQAAEKFYREKADGLARQAEKIGIEIYEQLKAAGCYK